ncbi:hypothetical protein V6N13_126570 [Hibiscus sabdariffa]
MVVKVASLAAAIVFDPPVSCFDVAASSYPIRLGRLSGVIPSLPILWRSSGLSNTHFFLHRAVIRYGKRSGLDFLVKQAYASSTIIFPTSMDHPFKIE